MKKALIVGGARSGKYIALLLTKHNYQVTLTDINIVDYKAELEASGIKVVDNGHPDSLLAEDYALVIKNPGIKYDADFIVKLLALNYKIYNEIEIALRFVDDAKVFAVSGTNGKTTTVSMLYAILKQADKNTYLGGNIGIPISEIVYKNKNINNLVIELSSFQLDGMYDFKPNFAALTNLQADHLDYYANVEQYYLSKQKIYQNQDKSDYFIVNNDDKLIVTYLKDIKANLINIGIDNASLIKVENNLVYFDNELLFNIDKLSLVGQHNVKNAIMAAVMAKVAKVDTNLIQQALYDFKAIEHRIEYVTTINEVKYYNDSKATNIDALVVALESFDKPVILLAGGYDKKISFEALRAYNDKIKQAILFGETAKQLSTIFVENIIVDDLECAVRFAKLIAKANDVVLFSPACASFDQFKDFEERGRLFKQYVMINDR